jgi:hypothetical protein
VKTGIQEDFEKQSHWIPAFAGMMITWIMIKARKQINSPPQNPGWEGIEGRGLKRLKIAL